MRIFIIQTVCIWCTCQAKPVLDVLRDKLTDKQMQCLVIRHISTGVQVQHYVYLHLELRRYMNTQKSYIFDVYFLFCRLHMLIRNAASLEKDFDSGKTSWNDWIGEATERTRGETFVTQPNNGFSKRYEKSRATNLVKLSAAETSSDEILSEVFEQQKWTPTISTVNTTKHMQHWNKSTDKILPPTCKSPEGNDNVIECSSL